MTEKHPDGRERVHKKCEWCEEPMYRLRTAKFCSNRCRQANKYAKKSYAKFKEANPT